LSQNGDYVRLTEEGVDLANNDHYNNAIQRFDKAIKIIPADRNYDLATILYNKGLAHFLLGEHFEALRCFDKASKLLPKSGPILPYIWYNKGITLGKIERYGEAILCFDAAGEAINHLTNTERESHPKQLDQIDGFNIKFWLSYNKGIALSKLEKYEEAVESFDNAKPTSEDTTKGSNRYSTIEESERALASYNKGYALGRLKKWKEALTCFKEATDIDNCNADAWRNRCFVLYKKEEDEEKKTGKSRDYNEVMACFKKAREMDPNFPYTLNTEGYIRNSLGTKKEEEGEEYFKSAKCVLEDAIEIDPKFALAWYNKGYSLIYLERIDDAINCFDKAISIDLKNPYAWNYKGYALLHLQRYEEALKCFERAIEAEEDNTYAWSGKGYVLFKNGKYSEAEKCFKRALVADKDIPESWIYRGLCFAEMSDTEYKEFKTKKEQAGTYISKKGSPRSSSGNPRHEAIMQVEDTQKDQAIHCINMARNIDADDTDDTHFAWRSLGYVYGKYEEYEKALEWYNKAIENLEHEVESKRSRVRGLADAYRNKAFLLGKSTIENKTRPEEAKRYEEEAKKFYKIATAIDPRFSLAWNSRGYYLLMTAKDNNEAIKEAICYFETAIACERENGGKRDFALPFYNKGCALLKLQKYEEALELFNEAINSRQNFDYAWNGKGYALNYLERHLEAIECFDRAIKLDQEERKDPELSAIEIKPPFNFAWNGKGYALNSLGRNTEAIECFDNIIRQCINYFDEYFKSVTKLKEKEENNDKGEVNWHKVIYYKRAVDCYNKATVLFNSGLYREAVNYFDGAIIYLNDALASGDSLDKPTERWLYNRIGVIDNARYNIAAALHNRALALFDSGIYREAVNYFDGAIASFENIEERMAMSKGEIKNNIKQAYLKKGEALYMLDDYVSARNDFRKVLDGEDNSNSNNPLIYETRNYMGLTYYRLKDLEKAIGEYDKVINESKELNSNKIAAYYNLGLVYVKQNKIDNAKSNFKNCLVDYSSPNTKLNGKAKKTVIAEQAEKARKVEQDEKAVIAEQAEKARKALEKLDQFDDHGDWFTWWFRQQRFKRILGLAIIAIVLFPFVAITEMVLTNGPDMVKHLLQENSDSIWLAVIVIAPLVMLLLPNFSRVKVGSVELDIQTPSARKQIEQIEPQIDVIHSEMPAAYPMQSFKAAVQYSDVSTAFQNLSVVMPHKYEPNHAFICKNKMFLPLL
jgi:tetratricopeptide (TPR) repeat protein